MSPLRILISIVLTIFCFSSGLYLLVFGIFLGAFAAAVMFTWLMGTLAMPDP